MKYESSLIMDVSREHALLALDRSFQEPGKQDFFLSEVLVSISLRIRAGNDATSFCLQFQIYASRTKAPSSTFFLQNG